MTTWGRIGWFAAFCFGIGHVVFVSCIFSLRVENDSLRAEIQELKSSVTFDLETAVSGTSTVTFTPGSDSITVTQAYDSDVWERAMGEPMPRAE